MANWSNLKSSVASVIKTNENNEITGQALQDVLNSIISNLGANAQFAGVATPETIPGTPDGDVFYLTGQAGIYSNFSQITLENGEVAALIWNGSSWTKETIYTLQENEKIPLIEERLSKLESKEYLTDGSVTTEKIAEGAVTKEKLADEAVYPKHIVDDAITAMKIAENAVGTYKIQDGAVTTEKIAEGAVTAEKIAEGAIPTVVNDLTTGGADKALSAEMGKKIWDSVDGVIGLSDKDITSTYTKITGKQAYGNVGSSIKTSNLAEAEYIVIETESVKVNFTTAPQAQVSSYLQYTDSTGKIVSRKFEGLGNNINCEEIVTFPTGATKCYVTGAIGSIKVYTTGNESLFDKTVKRIDAIESPVYEHLIDETESVKTLKDITSTYTKITGKQAYGNVGSSIAIGDHHILEYVAIDTEGVIVKFISEKEKIDVSSYLQYVDANGIILARDFVNIGVGVECEIEIKFPSNAVRAYVTGSIGTIRIFDQEYVTKVSQFDAMKIKLDGIPNIGKLSDIIVAENPESVIDAINKACTLSIISNATVLNKDEAFDMWGQSDANNYFLSGSVGNKISTLGGSDVRNIKIPVKDGDMITYPMFKTSETNGSFLVDSNNIILEAFINNTEPNGTMNTVTISGYEDKEVYFYLSLYPYSSVTGKITIKTAESQTEQIPINEYLPELLSNDYKESVSEKKALTTVGASMMYEELSNRMSSGSSILFPCKDYGVMPSCQYGDSEAFLQDGVDAEGNAIIKYSDVIAKYDELVSVYPSYIKKKELGYDASGTIPMYAYTLEPKYPTQSIYLQAGVHGWEPDPVFALAMIATLIANAYGTTDGTGLKVDDDALKYIRENVKVTIVPCVNPYGFNNRADCGIDKRGQAQNNANGVQLNSAWKGNAAEAVAVRNLIEELKHELSFAIDMHSTVWENSRDKYGCFYAGVNNGSASLLTVFKTYEWLYRFYDMKYPSIVQGDSVPNPFGDGYASIGTMTGTFNSWIYSTYGIESTTMEFSDHVWTSELHTSVAMSVAVNMYLNQFVQHICAGFKSMTPKVDGSDIYPAKG